ncbi:hypothetical protein DAPPUDRAFT_333901 [Daphnia pulex]|uniref:Mediator of RNA polymerase II transcription subunit 10 n=1 Tax=Daphnia pulex TaxID=6669 RepID=E9HU56_DAPPU|nr:hypothetical protein DAPPUDRAFT_333901 [Daphnia pulex]|eukprot:EFX64729.1 hypothetical protein DAPPUDRAFT_333901 [Daphnia pulex]
MCVFLWKYIDEGLEGRNPQLYTKDCMVKAQNKNEQVKGKTDSHRMFRGLRTPVPLFAARGVWITDSNRRDHKRLVFSSATMSTL